jgi:AraC-like DNA-binding protein
MSVLTSVEEIDAEHSILYIDEEAEIDFGKYCERRMATLACSDREHLMTICQSSGEYIDPFALDVGKRITFIFNVHSLLHAQDPSVESQFKDSLGISEWKYESLYNLHKAEDLLRSRQKLELYTATVASLEQEFLSESEDNNINSLKNEALVMLFDSLKMELRNASDRIEKIEMSLDLIESYLFTLQSEDEMLNSLSAILDKLNFDEDSFANDQSRSFYSVMEQQLIRIQEAITRKFELKVKTRFWDDPSVIRVEHFNALNAVIELIARKK